MLRIFVIGNEMNLSSISAVSGFRIQSLLWTGSMYAVTQHIKTITFLVLSDLPGSFHLCAISLMMSLVVVNVTVSLCLLVVLNKSFWMCLQGTHNVQS